MKLKYLTKTCDACPSQWSGMTVDDKEFYARYRWGELTVVIGGEEIISREYGDEFDGRMTTEEMLSLAGIKVVS